MNIAEELAVPIIEKQITLMHKGNKSYLPQKLCKVCGKPMTWRKKWEKNWAEVKYCSDRCRMKNKNEKRNSMV